MRRAAALLLALALASPAGAQGSAPVLTAIPKDAGGSGLAGSFWLAAAAALEAGGERASCLVTLEEGTEGATHGARLSGTQNADGTVTWVVEVVALAGGEVVARAEGTGSFAEAGAAAAEAALAALCGPVGGASGHEGPWEASGGGAEIVVSGRVEQFDRPFTLEGEFPGGTAVFTYTPINPSIPGNGDVDYAAGGSGVTASGAGIYTLVPQGDGTLLLSQTTDGCVDGIPNSCRTNTELITLTPVGP